MRSARARRQAATATRRASTTCRAPSGASFIQQRRLERLKLDGILVRQHDVLQGAQAVPEGILRRPGLAHLGPRPARLRAVLAAGFGTRIGHGNGRAKRGADHPTWRDSLAGGGARWEVDARAPGRARGNASLADHRNIVHLCCRAPAFAAADHAGPSTLRVAHTWVTATRSRATPMPPGSRSARRAPT